jgi:hypothetical protein
MRRAPLLLGLLVTGVLSAACDGRALPRAAAGGADAGRQPEADAQVGTDAGADASPDLGPAPGAVEWGIAVGAGAPAGGSTTVRAIVPLPDGSVLVAGGFTGTVSFAPDVTETAAAPRGAFVARYRSDQRLVWVTTLSAPGGDVEIADMTLLDAGEVAIVGWFASTLAIGDPAHAPAPLVSAGGLDLFAARIATDGSVRWSKRAGGADDDIARGGAARIAPDGSVALALTGAIGPGAQFGTGERAEIQAPAGSGPIFVAVFDGADGSFAWAAFPGGEVPAQGYDVAIEASGLVGVTGYVNGLAPFGTDPEGTTVTVDPATGRAFVAAWDAQGRLAWALPLAGSMGEGDAIVDAPDGGFIAAGLYEGAAVFGGVTLTSDSAAQPGCFLAAVGADGALHWARRLAGSGVHPWRLRRDSAGDLFLAASFGGTVWLDPDGPRPVSIGARGDDDAAFIQLDPAGALRWATTGGGLGDDEAGDFAPSTDGTSWAGGSYAGPATFGDDAVTLDSGTGGGGFLLHLEP